MATMQGLSVTDPIAGRVSVVIPTFQQVSFIRETLDSVIAQDYRDIEIIVTDDGSTDGTAQIISEYAVTWPGRIVPVFSPVNTGIAANFNRGLALVKGEYIAWLGGDDLMYPEKISRQVALLQQNPDAVGCCHDAEVFESDTGQVYGAFSELFNGKQGFREGGVELWFDAGYFMLPSTVMIRSAAAPAHGFDERLKYANDWLFDIEVFRQGRCVVINETLGRYRRHGGNVTGNVSAWTTGNEDGMLALCIVDARYPELHHLTRRRRAVLFFGAASKAYFAGEKKKCRGYLLVAARQGAVIKSMVLYAGLTLFGPMLARLNTLMPYQRPAWFSSLLRMMKR